jgi:two-component system OmpR family response regulator
VARLRRKLGASTIETVRGIGYRMGTPGARV